MPRVDSILQSTFHSLILIVLFIYPYILLNTNGMHQEQRDFLPIAPDQTQLFASRYKLEAKQKAVKSDEGLNVPGANREESTQLGLLG